MTATCYGHAGFFVMAQKHAGDARATVVPVASVHGRNLAEIASDRASIVVRLARVAERKCGDRCAAVRIEGTTLNARLVALDVESAEAKRRQVALDRADAERATVKADPLAELLADLGVSAGRVALVAGMAFAVVIECVACFCWLLALRPAESSATRVTPTQGTSHVLAVTRVTRTRAAVACGGNDAVGRRNATDSPAAEQTDDLTRILTATRNGTLRGTVSEIRKHLGCSQAKAAALRKQVARQMQSSDATTEQ
ncbi:MULTISPECIES: hypothetical protein [Paraburkholderia]|uniref:hypothetical protein n=1 Tax=Paraburkholderia TaxID=1822464 RepID=UPI002254C6E3|nr:MULTISPECIES: hypothetical protein [Paraburkholderia]MCX4157019.1 hypothetical protein [Paraburkholderia aspalathi]MDN7166423.1 hypothetical protein [Paraburkholderia sp. SECH2]MDQ6394909.1 hypothetical protein [Paraburkholderia aspalathi]